MTYEFTAIIADVQKAGYHVQEVRIDGDEPARLISGINLPC